MSSASLTIAASAVATAALLFPARVILRRAGIVDKPNVRSSHTIPTVRGGGIVVVAVVGAAMGWAARDVTVVSAILLLFIGLAVVSFIDDLRGLKARTRFTVQVVCAAIAVEVLVRTTYPSGNVAWLGAIAVVAGLWVAGYTNAFNFMDGINGIAAIQAISTGIGTALVGRAAGVPLGHPALFLAFVVGGAGLGFLPHNFPRARVFMGDVSSATLGFLLAVLAFWISRITSAWVLLWLGLLHSNFVLDTAITLFRRARRGDRLHEAHREHFYQRLVRAGWSHTAVTMAEAGLQIVVVLALWQATNAAWPIKVGVGAGVILVWLAFFAFAEYVFRKSPAGVAALQAVKG